MAFNGNYDGTLIVIFSYDVIITSFLIIKKPGERFLKTTYTKQRQGHLAKRVQTVLKNNGGKSTY